MYLNLRAEMARHQISNQRIAELLGVRVATVSDKLNGHYRFYYDECLKIKTHLFPQHSLEYLFEKDQKGEAG